jgi:leader peptidase (prepilin peptidase)/N-methyltransferase
VSTALIVGCAALGAAAGALAPWPAHRLSVESDAPPRSACAACSRPFPAGLSGWVRGSARCPECRKRIAHPVWAYALAGAVAFGLLAWAIGPDASLVGFLAIAAVALPLTAVDIASLRLPDPLVLAAAVLGCGPLALLSMVDGQRGVLGRALLAALISFVAYLVLAFLPIADMGFGDVKLATVLGFSLGWLSWQALVLGLVLPYLVNGPVALGLLLTRRAGRRSDLPLGPALLAGWLLAVVVDLRVL